MPAAEKVTRKEIEAAAAVGAQIARRVQFDGKSDAKQWLGFRKEAAFGIVPTTAEVTSIMVMTRDAYGIYPPPPDELWQLGREYFARSPHSQIWVSFSDLSEETRDFLWSRIENRHVVGAGGFVEIRSTELRNPRYLILQTHDKDTHPFVLVTWVPDSATPVGWCWGHEGKKPEYWSSPPDGRSAYFIPVAALRPMCDLRRCLEQLGLI